jgi:hypothetical protein
MSPRRNIGSQPTRPRHIARVAAALGLAAAALTGTLAACSDAPTAPASAPAPAAGPSRLLGTTVAAGDTSYTTLTLSPSTNTTWVIGGLHKLQIAAGSVCDPATSGYGPSLWDAPCATATQPVTVTAKAWTSAEGHPVVTFSPDLRFAPGKVNTLWLNDRDAAQAGGAIVWCPSDGSACVDEGAADQAVATRTDAPNGKMYRRLKHFSGYTVVANRTAAAY